MVLIRWFSPLLLLGALVVPAQAQTNPHAGHGAASAPAVTLAQGEATVKKIDKTQGSLTLAHGALSNGMPAMTMAYRVKDGAALDKLQVGQKLRIFVNGSTIERWETLK